MPLRAAWSCRGSRGPSGRLGRARNDLDAIRRDRLVLEAEAGIVHDKSPNVVTEPVDVQMAFHGAF